MTNTQSFSKQPHSMTVQECRQILGDSVAMKSDDQIARILDDLEHLAAVMYDDLIGNLRPVEEEPNRLDPALWPAGYGFEHEEAPNRLDHVLWRAYAMAHPEGAF